MERRKSLNTSAQLAFKLYDAAFQALRNNYLAELVARGEMAVNQKGQPIHDLSVAQESELRARLRKLTPVMHTLMSKQSKSLAAGLYASKSGRSLSERSMYSSELKFGRRFKDNNAESTKSNAFEQVESDPGVAMVVMSVHSTDSAISHLAADGHEVLNIHDAHGTGLGTFEQTARNLNKATFQAMLEYSPAMELSDMLNRTVQGLTELLQDPTLPQEVKDSIGQAIELFEKEQGESLYNIVVQTRFNAAQADTIRLEALSQLRSIDQYALEGGNYVLTNQDRDAAQAKRAAVNGELAPQVLAALDGIYAVFPSAKPQTPATPAPAQTITQAFGPVGKSAIASDAGMVEFFRRTPDASVADVIDMLANSGKLGAVNMKDWP